MTARRKKHANAATIGARIREKREALGLTQADVGAALDVTYQMVWKYEQGKGRLSAEQLARIAVLLKTDAAFFYS